MTESTYIPFSRDEAVELWSWLVAGWANSLDASGARTLMDGVPNYADAGGSFEGVTRMLWGLGSWLSYPNRPAKIEWRGQSYDIEQLTRRAFVNGCDPASRGYWGHGRYSEHSDQRTVETGQISFALWQTRDRIWSRLNNSEQKNIIGLLDKFGQRPPTWVSNWALFWVLNHTGRKALHADYDQSIIDDVMGMYLDGVYCGDGWYDDVAQRGANHFDDYITWVFAMHVMAWAHIDGDSAPQQRDILLERVRAWMAHYPYFFAADGAYCEFGRSLAYKFARLGATLWAYKLGLWSHSPGMLKRLVGKHLRWYVDRGAVRPDGTLRQSLTATGSPEILERYISTGATYWAMQAFSGLWALADDDPFWTAEEEPLPAEKSDFVKVFPQPGWVLTAKDGHVHRYNAGSVKPGYGAKYSKLFYSTRFPFNVGLDDNAATGGDNCLRIGDGGSSYTRSRNLKFAVGETGWLRTYYVIETLSQEYTVDTVIIPMGDVHLRAHIVIPKSDEPNLYAVEGSPALGYDAGAIPVEYKINEWRFAESGGSVIGMKSLLGYGHDATLLPGTPSSVYGFNLVMNLSSLMLAELRTLACMIYAGGKPDVSNLPQVEEPEWAEDGSFSVRVNGDVVTVPPLP